MTTTKVILTNYGNNKILEAIAEEKNVYIAELVYGDGGGESYEPQPTQTTLVNPIGSINSITRKFDATDGFIYFSGTILSTAPAFTMREIGLFDELGGLIAIGTIPATSKPEFTEGLEVSLPISIGFKTSAGSVILVEPGSSFDYVTREWVTDNFQVLTEKNAANGYAGLDEHGVVPDSHSPLSYTVTNVEPANAQHVTLKNYAGTNVIPNTDKLSRDLSDINATGLDKLSVSKCYETGVDISFDKDGFIWIERLMHSKYGAETCEIVGTPTITEKGYMTASGGNYAKMPVTKTLTYPFVVDGGFVYKEVTSTRDIYTSDNEQIRLFIDPLRISAYAYDGTTVGSCVINIETIGLKEGDEVRVKTMFVSPSERILKVSLDDGKTWPYEVKNANTLNLELSSITEFLISQFSSTTYYTGQVMLSKVSVSSLTYYNGFQKYREDTYKIGDETVVIPYREARTNSKICHISVESDIQKVYAYQGFAPYYVLDEDDEEFTLPAGELYGMLPNTMVHAVVESYENTASWYRLYDDNWIEQGGTVSGNNGMTLTFLKSFRNDGYYISIMDSGSSRYAYGAARNTANCVVYGPTSFMAYWYACGYAS